MTATRARPLPASQADAFAPQMELRGSTGRPLSGAAAAGAQRAAEERAAEAERREEVRALARYLIARDSLEGIAGRPGRDDTRRIARLAGIGQHRTLEIWADEDARAEAAREQQAQRHRLAWEQDPRHDPRVTEAIRLGAPPEQVSALMSQAAREYAERPPVGVIGPPGLSHFVERIEYAPEGPAAQKSLVVRDWSEFPDHQPGYAAGFMPGPATAAEARLAPPSAFPEEPGAQVAPPGCGHVSPAEARFCGTCGVRLVAQASPATPASVPPLIPSDPRSA